MSLCIREFAHWKGTGFRRMVDEGRSRLRVSLESLLRFGSVRLLLVRRSYIFTSPSLARERVAI